MNEDELWQQQIAFTPNGAQTMSKCPDRFVSGVYPKLVSQGHGGNVVDVNGKVYVDYIAGLGAVSVGYNNAYVNNAIKAQLTKGISFSLPNSLEGEVAKRISELVPSMEMSKFTKTGSDACAMAVKCARAYTKRSEIIAVGYHGWHDTFTILTDKTAGIPDVTKWLATKHDYNNISTLASRFNAFTAAIILEPFVFKNPKDGFIEEVFRLAHANGSLVIFDETVTGGRTEGFTAQALLKVKPDLTVLGKGLANGMPLAIVGGSEKVMKTFERSDFFASTTFGGECLSLAAFLATADILEKHIPKLIRMGQALQDHFNDLFNLPAICEGYPTRTQFVFPTALHKALFWQECVKQGVLFGYSNFAMVEHTDKDLAHTKEVMMTASVIVKQNWQTPGAKLEGSAPIEVFRLANR